MKYYFEDLEKQIRLKEILEEWIETPYRHHVGVKQLGCDCIHFVARVLEEMNIIKWRRDLIPDYPKDWHMHNTRQLLKDALEREVNGEWVELGDSMNGDIVLYHFGKAVSHAAIYFEDYGYQAIDHVGVCKLSVKDPLIGHPKFRYRVKV